MALVDVPGNGKSDPGAVEIILRAARLGLFTAAEARRLIDRVRPHAATPNCLLRMVAESGSTGRRGARVYQSRSDTAVSTFTTDPAPQIEPDPQPMVVAGRSVGDQVRMKIFVLISFIALIAAVPIA